MKKIDLGQTLGLLANVGVVVGIIFLVVEIQQNTRTAEFNAYQSLIAQINSLSQMNITSPQVDNQVAYLAELSTAELAREDISVEENSAIDSYFFLRIRHGDLAYYQFELGMLPETRLESALGPLRVHWCSALFRQWWAGRSFNFVAGYRTFIDSKMSEC